MKVGIHGKEFNKRFTTLIENIFQTLKAKEVEIYVSAKFEKHLFSPVFKKYKWKGFSHGANLKKLDFFLSIGGDGTLLDSVTYVGAYETPILGINIGRLG